MVMIFDANRCTHQMGTRQTERDTLQRSVTAYLELPYKGYIRVVDHNKHRLYIPQYALLAAV